MTEAAFDLFHPMLDGGRVDRRLLTVLGLVEAGHYTGTFHPAEGTSFDFCMESPGGLKLFFALKLAEDEFGRCENDTPHQEELEQHYRPLLRDHLDAKWLEPARFCANHEVLRHLSYLGRYPESGVAFIFPRARPKLESAEATIKQIVSKSLAPRVAIFYLEYVVQRILDAVADDPALTSHYLAFRDKYLLA